MGKRRMGFIQVKPLSTSKRENQKPRKGEENGTAGGGNPRSPG
jgi:hypothetical protein